MKFIATLRDYIWFSSKIFISMFIYFCLYSWLVSSLILSVLEWNPSENLWQTSPQQWLENCCLHHPGLWISWAHRHALTPTCLICKAGCLSSHLCPLRKPRITLKPHTACFGTYLVLVRDGSVPSALLFVSGGGSTKWSELLITQLLEFKIIKFPLQSLSECIAMLCSEILSITK